MDIIPTSLLIRCKTVFSEIIADLVNLSCAEDKFPTVFKQASVTPLIKGQSLDKSEPSNYRPISNLSSWKHLNACSYHGSNLTFLPLQISIKISLPIDPVAPLRLPYNCFWTTSTARLMQASWHFLCYLTLARHLIPSITLSYSSAWTVASTSQALYTPGYSPICLVGLSLWEFHLLYGDYRTGKSFVVAQGTLLW